MGQNVLVVFPGSQTSSGVRSGSGTSQSLIPEDVQAIMDECPTVEYASPVYRRNFQIVAGNQNWFTYVEGVGPDYPTIRSWPLQSGDFFNDQQIKSAAKVCVLGQTVAQQLFASENPIGESVRILNVPFGVIGVLTVKGQSVKGQDQDDVILVPSTTHLQRLYRKGRLYSIIAMATSSNQLGLAQQQVADLLRQRHRISNPSEDDFTVRNQQEIAETATATARIMTVLLASIASVSLVVGGIGIMNIMLVSVTERTREIGIRRAVGATKNDILFQFLVEAIVVSSAGGLVGILVGVASTEIVASSQSWPILISSSSILVAFLFAGAVGVFFGFYPAFKAAALSPIDSLRYE